MSDPTEDRVVRARVRRQLHADEDEIPRLPRGRGIRISMGQVLKIVLTAGLLVMLIAIRRPCSENVSKFVIDMDRGGSGSAAMPHPGTVEQPQEFDAVFTPDMTEAEIKAAFEKARAKHAAKRAGSGSAAPPSSGSATAP